MDWIAPSLWADSTPGAWVLLALALYGLCGLLSEVACSLRRLIQRPPAVAVSILVLIHNQEAQIEGLVKSLATRGWGPACDRWEVILVDLESTDDTPLLLEKLARQFGHIRLLRLSREQAMTPCDAALLLCRSPVAVLLDLRHQVDVRRLLLSAASLWQ